MAEMTSVADGLDPLDRALIGAMRRQPRASLSELARTVGVARGTVYSRLDRLEREGVIVGYGPDVDAARAGYGVLAFCTLEIAQGAHAETIEAISRIPEVLDIHTVTGVGDLLCRVVARSNDDLHRVLLEITGLASVGRSQTQLALHTSHRRTVAELVDP